MSREFQPREHSTSWGVFNARIERVRSVQKREYAAEPRSLAALWWSVGGLLFGTGLIFSAYAFQGGHWWLWLATITPLAIVLFMSGRAVSWTGSHGRQAVSLDRFESARFDYLGRPRGY